MSGFLARIATRALGAEPAFSPRPRSRFDPTPTATSPAGLDRSAARTQRPQDADGSVLASSRGVFAASAKSARASDPQSSTDGQPTGIREARRPEDDDAGERVGRDADAGLPPADEHGGEGRLLPLLERMEEGREGASLRGLRADERSSRSARAARASDDASAASLRGEASSRRESSVRSSQRQVIGDPTGASRAGEPSPVVIHIGRIDVRAVPKPAVAEAPKGRASHLRKPSLDAYLQGRDRGRA